MFKNNDHVTMVTMYRILLSINLPLTPESRSDLKEEAIELNPGDHILKIDGAYYVKNENDMYYTVLLNNGFVELNTKIFEKSKIG